ncbi:MAG: serine-pyruvate aminotransferase/archaeal aspartate aminotransferase [halophilic archaeon J07HB67]|jgi:Serine-pyruvate aminotransferase/archaeal aspartate aminotransferase|nr:MAG: serine-pyruvate aminotransferase/archaeal aspartate aminotransferase [halophilic archaeon J07HB67]
MSDDFLLLNPGPVPVRESVLDAMAEPMVSHRSAAFESIYERAQAGVEYVFERSTPTEQSTGDGTALLLNGTATMGMEATVANLVDSDDHVVALVNGKFGRRFARIAERHTDDVTRVEVPWGESIPLSAVDDAVRPDTRLVTMVHNETSTGLQNPAWGVGRLVADHDAYFAVDGVTSVGGDVFCIDDWHVDVAITDAQKALETPPGISAVYVTSEAQEAFDGESAPFYEDLDWHLRKAESHQTPFTSAVPLFRGMAEAVEAIEREGMPARIDRHHRQARAFRAGFAALGLDGFPEATDHTVLSNTVTAVQLPESIRGEPTAFFAAVEERNVSISGGQGHLSGDIFRVSNMGSLADEQVMRGVRVVGEALEAVGVDTDPEAGVAAAREWVEVN